MDSLLGLDNLTDAKPGCHLGAPCRKKHFLPADRLKCLFKLAFIRPAKDNFGSVWTDLLPDKPGPG